MRIIIDIVATGDEADAMTRARTPSPLIPAPPGKVLFAVQPNGRMQVVALQLEETRDLPDHAVIKVSLENSTS